MAKKRQQQQQRTKGPDKGKIRKPKVSALVKDKIAYVDYKDVNLLRRFMSERAKIRARRVTGNSAQQQREVARAIRVAREMALLPYAVRQVTTRRGSRRDREPRSGDGPRGEAPTPDAPPPSAPATAPADADAETAEAELSGDEAVSTAEQPAEETTE